MSPRSLLLILGAHGQVGRALAAQAQQAGIAYRALGVRDCDITDPAALRHSIQSGCTVVNCAGYTAVDRAESDVGEAMRVNATGAENIAVTCADAGVPLIHLSTDYVFDGRKREPWREDDPTAPLSVYGKSKLAGELAVRRALPSHVILRTSWIFSARGENFVKTILRISRERPQLHVVSDQIGGPTAADDLAAAMLKIAAAITKPGFTAWGTYHFCGAPPTSWYEFARRILENRDTVVLPVASKDYPRPAARPANSVLDCERIRRVFAIAQPDWRASLRNVLREIEMQAEHTGT